jgi:predicted Holliday junction resolvase-like endonuclease
MKPSLVDQLLSLRGLKIECPHCNEEFSAKRAKLFSMFSKYPDFAQKKMQSLWDELSEQKDGISERKREIVERRKEMREEYNSKPTQIQASTESINFGQIVEKVVPSIDGFPYDTKDCRPLFDPIDYIVFKDLRRNGNISALLFVDVKSGSAKLNKRQQAIKHAIDSGKLHYRQIDE